MSLDVLFIHPPSVYDFRKKTLFTGPIARTVPLLTPVYICIPIGFISMGEYLFRHGYKIKISNIAERMLNMKFNVEDFISKIEADIFGIDLHWCVHSHGAIEVAKICKKYHPNSLIVLGGLTATKFYSEILEQYPFIDMVIRGEAEEPILSLINTYNQKNFSKIPNLSYRKNGKIKINEIKKPCNNLDNYNFTKLDLIEIKEKMLYFGKTKFWHIPVCRGCIYNCLTCGGSNYSYQKYFQRDKPAFRSPNKIVEDINYLIEQHIKSVFLFQDIRMGGKKYVKSVINDLKNEKLDIENITLELFYPASKNFLEDLKSIPAQLIYLTISPESGNNNVRKVQGREYSTLELLKFINNFKSIKDERFILNNFFMIGLKGQNKDTINETWKLWDSILGINKNSIEGTIHKPIVLTEFDVMTYLDPGSIAFDFSEKYGYKLFFKNFSDYQKGMLNPSWKYWFSYETNQLNRSNLANIALNSWEMIIKLYKKHHLITDEQMTIELKKIKVNRIIIKELDKILQIKNSKRQELKIQILKNAIDDNKILNFSWTLKNKFIDIYEKFKK